MILIALVAPSIHTCTLLRELALMYTVLLRLTNKPEGFVPMIEEFAKVIATGSHIADGHSVGRL